MYAPQLYDLEVSRDTIQEFRGYNHNLRIADNEFFDMKNLTGKYYPVLSPRGKRGTYLSSDNGDVNGILGKDKLVTIRDNSVYYGTETKPIFTLPREHTGDRQLISMGAYVIIFPDMYYLNTANLDDFGPCSSGNFSFSGSTTLKQMGETGAAFNVLDAIWSDELFPISNYYIDPFADSDYILFGIPGLMGGEFNLGDFHIKYDVNITLYDTAKYGAGWPLFSIMLGEYGEKTRLIPEKPTDIAMSEEYTAKYNTLYNATTDGMKVTMGHVDINISVDNSLQLSRRVMLVLTRRNSGGKEDNKFYRTTIEEGTRRLLEKDETVIPQICIKTESTPEATYNTPSCWREEQTTVNINTNHEFITWLQEIFDNDEPHIFTMNIGGTSISTTSINTKYGADTKNIAKNVVTLVNGSEINVLGYLDFYTAAVNANVDINITALNIPMDYLIESNNRLWGCRYGPNYKGDFVNEIYASARGSFRSFFKFDGTSDDSYILTLGSGGAFTGAATLGGMPVFFKEGSCHIISGSYPSTYHLTTETGTWVASGSSKSICLADSMLYFHGKDGIYVYDGASKQKISDALGNERYKNAVGGFAGGKYYVSMQDSEGKYNLFVFDQTTGMWHKEDSTQARFFAPYSGDLYMVVNDTILTVNGSQGVSEGDVEWYAETGKIGFATPDSKYVGKLMLKMILPVGSSLQVYIQYDSDGYWEYKGPVVGLNSVCFALPIMPRRCDHFAIRLSGKGDCKIFSITKTYESGGEM
jgi:hypothetical protein